MKSVTIRELRQHWPETEKALLAENELTITRDGRAVAKLVRIHDPKPQSGRWNPEGHKKWLKKVWGNSQVRLVDKYLGAGRAERTPKGA
jgi:antitoxin (DNA-binding transcriptional repressor) of toxin-antitoxin stability system